MVGIGLGIAVLAVTLTACAWVGFTTRASALDIDAFTVARPTADTGLAASLRTDRWRAWLIVVPLCAGTVAMLAGQVRGDAATATDLTSANIVGERPQTSRGGARLATLVCMAPAVLMALRGYGVLRRLLIADLLCAGTVVPALLGLWRRATPAGALSVAVAVASDQRFELDGVAVAVAVAARRHAEVWA
ncbi:MAG: hypothetical protein WD250_11720 [Egibacteraceae bacterium]